MGQVTPESTTPPEPAAGTVVPDRAVTRDALAARFGDLLAFVDARDTMLTAVLGDSARLVEVATFLRDDASVRCAHLADVTAVDYLPREPRFEVVYHFHALTPPLRLRLRVPLAEGQSIPSLTGLWPGANFSEREVFDLFGITFSDHPNLERILLPDDYEGYPLRRDHPLGDVPVEFDLPARRRFDHA